MKDVPVLQVTPENFIVPEGEEHLYHCVIEIKRFDADTGERLSTPRVQVFGKKTFEEVAQHNLTKHGYSILVLHDPQEYDKGMREKAVFEEEERLHKREIAAEALRAAESKAQQDAIDKAVAEALAKQAADMEDKIAKAVAEKIKPAAPKPETVKPDTGDKPRGGK